MRLADRRVAGGRVKTIRDLQTEVIVNGSGVPLPGGLDAGQDGTVVGLAAVAKVRAGVAAVSSVGVEVSGVRVVEVSVLEGDLARPFTDHITGLVSDNLEDVGADVEATEGMEIPVGGDGRNLTVVVVVVVVGGANELLWDSVAQQDAQDAVLDGVGLVLIESDENKSVLHELLVIKKGFQEGTSPCASDTDIGVMAVAGHVGSDEHPLGKSIILEILVEHSEVLHVRQTVGLLSIAVVDDGRVVLANVVVGARLLVDPSHAFEASIWHILLILGPRDTLVLKEINNGRDVSIDLAEVIVLHAKVVTTDSSNVVGLTGMRDSMVPSESDSLGCQPLQVFCGVLALCASIRGRLESRQSRGGDVPSPAARSKSVFSSQTTCVVVLTDITMQKQVKTEIVATLQIH
jgi:hypothetical protein